MDDHFDEQHSETEERNFKEMVVGEQNVNEDGEIDMLLENAKAFENVKTVKKKK